MPDEKTWAPEEKTSAPGPAVPPEAVGPLMRGIAVLREAGDAGGRVSLSDLVRSTGLARSTVDRIAATFARMGYVRVDGHWLTLAPRLMEVGNAYLAALRLPALLGPLAERLAEELDESVSLAVPDGDGIRFVHQTTRRRTMSLVFRIGDLLPAERTAPGPLFAADWDASAWARWRERRAADPSGTCFPAAPPRVDEVPDLEERVADEGKRGVGIDDQLIEPGLLALAVPVRAPDGTIACALSAVSHTSRHSAASLRKALLSRVREAAGEMERVLRQAPADRSPAGAPAAGLADWTSATKQELGAGFVESLARGLTVLTAFGERRPELTLTAVADATGLARATARRALITLEHLGHVTSTGRTFRLTPRVLALGYPALSRTTLPEIATPHLAALVRRVHDSASLAVLVGEDIQYTARVATTRIMSVNISLGTRFPAYAASMGRVLLADREPGHRLPAIELKPLTPRTTTDPAQLTALLDQVAEQGYALVDEELEEGLRSLAVPVRDGTGRAVAALNVAMHSSRRTVEECVRDLLPELRATAAAIEADLHIAGRFTRIPS
ncbi:IclR family transcriptional regulator C-terminal domain-containing protein [Streptomyces sp. NPDC050428]|uniref:IclR family transcriptional regulator domain-containing protein n=1 Tax=Streptomyces sp. NPDC050428 TaxID=3155757 RepID=UPI00341A84F7